MLKNQLKKISTLKVFYVALFVSVLCPFLMWGAAAGDVNGSGVVDIVDALMTAQYYVGLNPANFQTASADVDGINGITIIDALMIAQYYVGLINQFPVQGTTGPTPTPTQSTTGGGSANITLNGTSITVNGTGAAASGSVVTITAGGTYNISGTLSNGQIVVNSTDTTQVTMNFNGVNITNNSSAPVNIIAAEETEIVLGAGTTNTITDTANYVFPSGVTEPNAAIFSNDDLKFSGSGSLTVKANYNDAISSDDGINLKSGTYTMNITAVDDGIRGKDDVKVKGGTITINSQGDGLKSDNEEDTTKGTIAVEAGTLNITAGGDAIGAQTTVTVTGGTLNLTSGGGSSGTVAAADSKKGIKGPAGVTINAGTFTLNCADDAIHANTNISITGGTFSIATGDDGIHGDAAVVIGGGTINITKCYEGIESTVLTFSNGNIHVVAGDDAINGANITGAGNVYLYINGGYIAVNGNGDGVDINGSVEMTAGTLIVNGPTAQMNGALDYDRTFKITGGLVVATGSSGMAQTPGTTSTQNALLLNMSSTQQANSIIRIQNSSGTGILTFAPVKQYQSLAFSSPQLTNGSYTVYLGGSMSGGSATDGLYSSGTYSGGSQYTTFTVSSIVTTIR